jgi:exonuclease-1
LKAENVDYIVAPYEADAQMAFMEREGLVDGIITEDSDMLVFGCRNVRQTKSRFNSTTLTMWVHR